MSLSSPGAAAEECRTVGRVIAEASRQLSEAGLDAADQEAVWLAEYALGLSRLQQVLHGKRELSLGDVAGLQRLVSRRTEREPLQYILGTQDFCGLEFEVNRSVLIPRPESTLLVQEAIRRVSSWERPVLVDVGTGSGCLAIALARLLSPRQLLAIDLSSDALRTAKQNAARLQVESVTWLEGDLLAPLAGRGLEQRIRVIVSNPPYVSESEWPTLQPEVRLYEPRLALVAGVRGTELHERLIDDAIPFLEPGGCLIMELGWGQSRSLIERVEACPAYQSVGTLRDEAGIERVLVAERGRG
ncbi:MAG: peptide chain release factor N(5)-glutamine methyltransferase [Nitrospira sp.]|nr:peptide chain release factor N(5)-glutamine methyltransferase [Nitrospira sp.]